MKTEIIRRRLPVIIMLVVTALMLFGFGRRCSTEESTLANDYRRPGGDTVAVAIEMSRLTYTLHNDTASGFDYTIINDIFDSHGLKAIFTPVTDLERAFGGLYDGEYDMVVASFASTGPLKEHFPLTDAVYIDRQVLVQRKKGDSLSISSQEQLMSDTVWMTQGSTARSRLNNMARELGADINVRCKDGYSAEQLAIAVAIGEVRQAVVGEAVARSVASRYPDLDISVPVSFNQFQCWAVAPADTALRDSVNVWLKDFKSTPRYEALVQKYFKASE